MQKDTTGQYIYGPPSDDPAAGFRPFGLTALPSNSMSGMFLVGNSSPQACVIFERAGLTVEISTEHSDYFVKNLVAIRAEERLALVVFRPGAFITGSFTQSPA